jgi:hypothetical protein
MTRALRDLSEVGAGGGKAATNPHQKNITDCHSERSEESIFKELRLLFFTGQQCFRIVKANDKGNKTIENSDDACWTGRTNFNKDLFVKAILVWYQNNGKVNPEWLPICKEERNQTTIKENSVQVSTYGGVRGRQR